MVNNHLKFAKVLAKALDSQFSIGKFRFGLDPLLGLFPVLGNITTAFLSFYLIQIARQMKLPDKEIRRMIWNIILDYLIGVIPILGTIGDFVYKSNNLNIKILENYDPEQIIEGEIIE